LCADGLDESRFPIGFTARDLTRDPFLVYAHDVTPAIEREYVFDEIAVLILVSDRVPVAKVSKMLSPIDLG
tara:strand:+ start:309 stop:521 length:213 start_codon:yes stop_codon:yes gene_type:complete